jgi:hypothetical protein
VRCDMSLVLTWATSQDDDRLIFVNRPASNA